MKNEECHFVNKNGLKIIKKLKFIIEKLKANFENKLYHWIIWWCQTIYVDCSANKLLLSLFKIKIIVFSCRK